MKKLTVTFVGYTSDIEAAKENVEDFLGNCPDEIKTKVTIEEIDFKHCEQYVIVVQGQEPKPCNTLEGALKEAMGMVNTGTPANKVTIQLCRVSYLDNEYDGINAYLKMVVDMKKIM